MHLLGVTCLMTAPGIPINMLVMYVATTNRETIAAAELLIVHLCFANLLQLISRILTVVIPGQYGVCYPVSIPCKSILWTLCMGRRVTTLFTFYLGLFRLLKIKNKHYFIFSNTYLHIGLAGNWILLTFFCLPNLILIPEDRPSNHNVTEHCICSIPDALTDKDTFVRMFDLVVVTGSLYFITALTSYVSIRIVWLLLKHKQTVFVNGTLNRARVRQRDLIAIKAVVALMVCYVTCSIIINTLRLYSESYIFHFLIIFADIYNVISPIILGLGYPSFRKAICIRCNINCHKSNAEHARSIS